MQLKEKVQLKNLGQCIASFVLHNLINILTRSIKYTLFIIVIGIVVVGSILGFGFYTMEIEDHYGDLQELYFSSKSGDVMVNKTTFEIGIVEKSWKRMNIRTKIKKSIDLYYWVYRNGNESKVELYRVKNKTIELERIEYSELTKLINNNSLKLVAWN